MSIRISAELSHICPVEAVVSHARLMEAAGFHRMWIPDTLVSPWEAWSVAGNIVFHTNRLAIGLGVTNPYTRHPVVMAQAASTLQQISGGRLSLAIGKGIGRFLEKAGIIQNDAAVKEGIVLLKQMMTGERTSLKGSAFQIDGIQLRTLPPEKPVPVYLAAMGPSSWELAMDVADGVTTVWHSHAVENRGIVSDRSDFPTAALIPFSLSTKTFMGRNVTTVEDLKEQIDQMASAGFDEAIIAYREMADLKGAAELIH